MFENILSRFFSLLIDFAADPLSFEQIEKAIDDDVSMAVSAPANRMLKIVGLQEGRKLFAGKLRSIIRVRDNPEPRLSASDGSQQRLQNALSCRAALW